MKTMILYRPIGPAELELIAAVGFRAFPPRLPEQPIFYPVTNESYAVRIAREWNVRDSGAGFVTRFAVDAEYAARFPVQSVGGPECTELWVPAEELDEFNRQIVGDIEVIAEFRAPLL
jgi:hypothetical protein